MWVFFYFFLESFFSAFCLENDPLPVPLHTQAVRRCQGHAKTRGDDITSKSTDTSANQKPEKRHKWHMAGKGSATTAMEQRGGEPHVWTDNEVELLLNITPECEVNKTRGKQFDTSRPQCSGRVNGHLSGR